MAQITSIVSEALQAKIRALLPSQAGFTEDLQAQNVIVPIVDLTETASGSVLREDLQTSLAYGSNTFFGAQNSTVTIADVGGFYRVIAGLTINRDTVDISIVFEISDGASSKEVYGYQVDGSTNKSTLGSVNIDFIVFLRAGDSLTCTSSASGAIARGSSRQIADLTGNLVNPSGFTSE